MDKLIEYVKDEWNSLSEKTQQTLMFYISIMLALLLAAWIGPLATAVVVAMIAMYWIVRNP